MAKEIELKLRLATESTEQLAEWLDQHAVAGRQSKLLNDYYDTPNLALARLRAALRIRTSEDGYEQTLKTRRASEAAVQVRNEWNWRLRDNALNHDLLRSDKVGDQWPVEADMSELEVVFSTNFRRRRWIWKHEDAEVEVVIDQGEIQANDQLQPLCETELEVVAGHAESLWGLLEQMQQQAALWLSDVSKAERGYRLAGVAQLLDNNEDDAPSQADSSAEVMTNTLFDFQRACEGVVWDEQNTQSIWLAGYPLWCLLPEQQRAPLTHLLCELSAGTQTELQESVSLAMDLTSITRSVAQMSTESQLSVRDCSATLAEARRQVLDMIECIKTDNITNPISELLTLIRD